MNSDMMQDNDEMARARQTFEQDARSRQLKKNWFVALVALWIVIWGFVGMSGIVPRPLWVVILMLLLLVEFGIALFGPRIGQSKTH